MEFLAPTPRSLLADPSVLFPEDHSGERQRRDQPRARTGSVLVERAHREAVAATESAPVREARDSSLAWLNDKAIAAVEDPAERLTLSFLHELVGEDRRTVQRELGIATLFHQYRYTTSVHGLETHLDHRDAEDQALLLSERYNLFERPLRRALRKASFINSVNVLIDNFKAANVPLSSSYEESRRGGGSLGRVSVRLRPNRKTNPFEVIYRLEGLSVGGGLSNMRAGYGTRLTDQLYISVRSNYRYELSALDMWGDLLYEVDDKTQVHVLLGNKMDIVGGTAMAPIVRSPVVLRAPDQSPGLMFYVEHLF